MSDDYVDALEKENELLRQKVVEQAAEISVLKSQKKSSRAESAKKDDQPKSKAKKKPVVIDSTNEWSLQGSQYNSFIQEFVKKELDGLSNLT